MLQFQLWKKLIVAVVLLGGVVYALPNLISEQAASILPGEKINLGLDLRGGSHLLLRVDIDAVADCPSGLNRWVIQQRLDKYLNGRHHVRAAGMDLDIWIPFFEEDNQVETDLEVRFVVDGVSLRGVDWGKLFVDAADMNERFRSQLEDEAAAIFEESLSDLPEIALNLLHNGIDKDSPLCSIEQSGGVLTVRTGDQDARFPCLGQVVAGIGNIPR